MSISDLINERVLPAIRKLEYIGIIIGGEISEESQNMMIRKIVTGEGDIMTKKGEVFDIVSKMRGQGMNTEEFIKLMLDEEISEITNGKNNVELNEMDGGLSEEIIGSESESKGEEVNEEEIEGKVRTWREEIERHYSREDLKTKMGGLMTKKTKSNNVAIMLKALNMYERTLVSDVGKFLERLYIDSEKTWRRKQDIIFSISGTLRNIEDESIIRMLSTKEERERVLEILRVEGLRAKNENSKEEREQEMTTKERLKWQEVETMQKKITEETLEVMREVKERGGNKSIKRLKECIITRLYLIDNAPRRRQDYAIMLMEEPESNKSESNWVDIGTGRVYINKYKNAWKYGEYTFLLSTETLEMIRKIGEIERYRQYIFYRDEVNESGFTEMTQEAFKRIVGESMNSTLLRKIYITSKQRAGLLEYTKEREELARAMGHSVTMQQTTYTKRPRSSEVYSSSSEEEC